jgi:hypothetical protein
MVLWKLRFWLIYEKIKLLLTSLIIRVTSLAPTVLGGVDDDYFLHKPINRLLMINNDLLIELIH